MCPYYESRFSNKEELSKPIDRLHLGSGLLEGDLPQWGIFNLYHIVLILFMVKLVECSIPV
jgi:hypothetical protein